MRMVWAHDQSDANARQGALHTLVALRAAPLCHALAPDALRLVRMDKVHSSEPLGRAVDFNSTMDSTICCMVVLVYICMH